MKEERSQITLEIDGEKKQFPRGITYREAGRAVPAYEEKQDFACAGR